MENIPVAGGNRPNLRKPGYTGQMSAGVVERPGVQKVRCRLHDTSIRKLFLLLCTAPERFISSYATVVSDFFYFLFLE